VKRSSLLYGGPSGPATHKNKREFWKRAYKDKLGAPRAEQEEKERQIKREVRLFVVEMA
jgi:hypothetical protein